MLEVNNRIDVFDADVRGDRQGDGRVAQYAIQPGVDKLTGDALGGVPRDSHHGNPHV